MPTPGKDTFIYYGANVAAATTELKNVKDSNLARALMTADTKVKGAVVATVHPIIHEISVEGGILYEKGDAGFEFIDDAYKNKTTVGLVILNGPKNVAGNRGVSGDFYVTKLDEGDPVEGLVEYSFVFQPAKTSTAFTFVVTVGS